MVIVKIDVKKDTARIIKKLHERDRNDKAILAAIRRSNSILSRQATIVWPMLFGFIKDKEFFSKTGMPNRQEKAVFTALRCYAVFEQGNDNERDREYINESSSSLFENLSFLRKDERLREALDRRVQAVLSSTNFESVSRSVVGLTKLVKANNAQASLNYPDLANDLYNFQFGYESSRKVAIKWGREYFSFNDQVNKESNED